MSASQKDINNLAWTMLGEATPGDIAGMTAVGSTVLNRLNAGNYGSSITDVVKAPNQYAAWGIGSQAASQGNNPDTRFPVGSPQFVAAQQLAQQLINGQIPDNTGGATDYRAASLGTQWAGGANTVNIGGNVFKTNSTPSSALAAISGIAGLPPTSPNALGYASANAPTPMSNPSWLAPSADQAPASNQLVNLNGKQVAVGTYASPSNPGSTFTIADDGTGKAVVTNNDPGMMNVAKMSSGTIAGGVLGQKLADAGTQVQANLGQAANKAKVSASQLGSGLAGLGSGLLSGLSGLFSGNSGTQPTSTSTPDFLPTGGSWLNLGTVPDSPSGLGALPSPSFTPSQMTVLNPAYTAYLAQQNADPISDPSLGYLPASNPFSGLGALPSATAAPTTGLAALAPPKYIKVTQPGTPPGTNLNLTGNPPANNGPAWITPQGNLTGQQTQAALMAQQNKQSPIPSFGANSSYAQNGGDVSYLNKVYG